MYDEDTAKALDFAKKFGVKVKAGDPVYKKHFQDDDQRRFVFPVTISRARRRMTLEFGQSIAAGATPPTAYEVLACMVKSDPGTFEQFCSAYGYDEDSRRAEKTWKACRAEWRKIERVFGDEDCLREFQDIT